MSTFFLLKANFFLLGSGKKKLKILFFLLSLEIKKAGAFWAA